VERAKTAGLQVILDMHNYGVYHLFNGSMGVRRPIGSAKVTYAHLADVWRRISAAFITDPGVIGYGLGNEPVEMPSGAQGWEMVSQGALDGIRSNGDGKLVTVPGYEWAGVQDWPNQIPTSGSRTPLTTTAMRDTTTGTGTIRGATGAATLMRSPTPATGAIRSRLPAFSSWRFVR
jgi:aryl-phospho-beta-D-glucosidase BglC (GH1 family)